MQKQEQIRFLEHTPIEEYKVNWKRVFVKREDLFDPINRNAKMRGINAYLLKHTEIKKIGVYDTRISRAGLGTANIAIRNFGIETYIFYQKNKHDEERKEHLQAQELGAKLYPCNGTRTSICFYQGRRIMQEEIEGTMLPLGLTLVESVNAVWQEANTIPKELCNELGTLVMCIGSGTMFSGVIGGLKDLPKKVYGITLGMDSIHNKWIREATLYTTTRDIRLLENAQIVNYIQAEKSYYEKENIDCPFECSQYYDKKAWKWLKDNILELEEPILSWNIGI